MIRPPSIKEEMRRLATIAAEINAYLLVVAIGLGVLDAGVFAAFRLPPLPAVSYANNDETNAAGTADFINENTAASIP